MHIRHPVRAAVAATAAFAPVSWAAGAAPVAADIDPPPSPTAPANEPAATDGATAGGCDANDYRIQKTAPVVIDGSGASVGRVELYYSPATRCVFGAVQINTSYMPWGQCPRRQGDQARRRSPHA